VSRTSACTSILADIGNSQLQLELSDRPEMNYWEEYRGDRVVPHIGVNASPTLKVRTTFPVLVDTLLGTMSVMEAAADEAYEFFGDTTTLMKCANILPYVMLAFKRAVLQRFPDQLKKTV
jgi:hypothetical protein